jgi:hypothetical protein
MPGSNFAFTSKKTDFLARRIIVNEEIHRVNYHTLLMTFFLQGEGIFSFEIADGL